MFASYVIIFLASLLGNSVIIEITRTDNSLKTTTKCLIMTQAYADLLITFIALPFFLYHRMMKILWFGGVFGFITCKMTLAAVFSVPQFSVLMLVMIAVDHFFCSTSTFATVTYIKTFEKNDCDSLVMVFCLVPFLYQCQELYKSE